MLLSTTAAAADSPSQLVAFFTKKVQPLILNKCAAGACHGGATAHEPRFRRGDTSGWIDRADTLVNMEVLTDAVGSLDGLPAFLASISRRHPSGDSARSLRLVPLTIQERAALEQWLAASLGMPTRAEPPEQAIAAPRPIATPSTTAGAASPGRPNRFRAMLEAAAHPLQLPPPQEPQGIILGRDGGR